MHLRPRRGVRRIADQASILSRPHVRRVVRHRATTACGSGKSGSTSRPRCPGRCRHAGARGRGSGWRGRSHRTDRRHARHTTVVSAGPCDRCRSGRRRQPGRPTAPCAERVQHHQHKVAALLPSKRSITMRRSRSTRLVRVDGRVIERGGDRGPRRPRGHGPDQHGGGRPRVGFRGPRLRLRRCPRPLHTRRPPTPPRAQLACLPHDLARPPSSNRSSAFVIRRRQRQRGSESRLRPRASRDDESRN